MSNQVSGEPSGSSALMAKTNTRRNVLSLLLLLSVLIMVPCALLGATNLYSALGEPSGTNHRGMSVGIGSGMLMLASFLIVVISALIAWRVGDKRARILAVVGGVLSLVGAGLLAAGNEDSGPGLMYWGTALTMASFAPIIIVALWLFVSSQRQPSSKAADIPDIHPPG